VNFCLALGGSSRLDLTAIAVGLLSVGRLPALQVAVAPPAAEDGHRARRAPRLIACSLAPPPAPELRRSRPALMSCSYLALDTGR
jgi:hypothetical protein